MRKRPTPAGRIVKVGNRRVSAKSPSPRLELEQDGVSTTRGSIYIVDDDKIILESLTEFLRLEGFDVDGGTCFDDAMQAMSPTSLHLDDSARCRRIACSACMRQICHIISRLAIDQGKNAQTRNLL